MNCTIVIPTLNEEDKIMDCIERINKQKQEGDETIVVDGGSDDNTVELCKESCDRVFIAKGSSIGKAREIGIEKADNEIVVSTDADALPKDGWLTTIRHHFDDDEELSVLWGNIEDKNGVPIRNLVGKFWSPVGGASGNNTAIRKEHYENLVEGYPDWNFGEDVAIIYKLAIEGKAKRDKDLVMPMDMDRHRYQTVPCIYIGGTSVLLGHAVGGKYGRIMKGMGVGMVGTELTYESMTGSSLHHDEVGMGMMSVGNVLSDEIGESIMGIGTGVVGHHLMTEGLSALETPLSSNSNEDNKAGELIQ